VATRSGNLSSADEKTWSSWSKQWNVDDGFLPVASPAGRFLQYRLTLTSNGRETPSAEDVHVIHQVGNLPPVVSAVTVKPAAKPDGGNAPGPKLYRLVMIKAGDPNRDRLRYTLEFRRLGTERWIKITDKWYAPKYVLDTRRIGDGKYELRVTASDAPSNPPESALTTARVSEPITADTAPPVVVVEQFVGKAGVTVSGVATDGTSRIVSLHYAVDSQSDWVSLLPGDGICDSASESFTFRLDDLEPGAHRVVVRAQDACGNAGYGAVSVTLERK
jgi:hypothetical protein